MQKVETMGSESIETRHARAVELQASGALAEAVALYRACIIEQADFAPALYNLGMILVQHGQYDAAAPLLADAWKADPRNYNMLLGYGIALKQAGHIRAAIEIFCGADRQAPDQPHAMCNLASIHNTLGEPTLGDLFLAEATRRAPDFPNVRWLNAMRLLRRKRYRDAWPLFESRFSLMGQTVQTTQTTLPRWQGEARPWALLREQGHGDCLMLARFVNHPALAGHLVGLEVTSPLVELLQHNFPQLSVADDVRKIEKIEAVLPLMSIPGWLNLEYADIPSAPYLSVPERSRMAWAERVPVTDDTLRLAVYWRGSPKHANDARRSIPFSDMRPLLEISGITWVSAQYDATEEEKVWMAEHGILHPGDAVRNFDDLAGLLSQVDGVIGVDSAPIHLAGALGVPVWMLVANSPDWRWGETGHRTAWYQRMLLIRQKKLNDWSQAVATACRGLRRIVGRRSLG